MHNNVLPGRQFLQNQTQIKRVVLDRTNRKWILRPVEMNWVDGVTWRGEGKMVVGVVDQNELSVAVAIQILKVAHVLEKTRKADDGLVATVT